MTSGSLTQGATNPRRRRKYCRRGAFRAYDGAMKGLAAGSENPSRRKRRHQAGFRTPESVAGCRLGAGWSKNFILASEEPKGSNQSTPLVSTTSVVAGAGFEPTTFGL